ncbi:hypothetical protein [Psychrobacillus phage Perkons]|nr:hypothetical protein [Psychrobacillus phage Perkons]
MENNERLKIIKETPYLFNCDVLRKDFQWLIRRIEELEQELHFEKATRIGMDSIERYTTDIKNENKKYRDALEFIRDIDNHPLFKGTILEHNDYLYQLTMIEEVVSESLK